MGRKRCIVSGCSAAAEEEAFRRRILFNGHAFCPAHGKDSNDCGCTAKSKLFLLYEFPTAPALRDLWMELLAISTERYFAKTDCVCGKHFTMVGRQKVPVKNIGRCQESIDKILEEHSKKIMRKMAERHSQTQISVAVSMENVDELATAAVVMKEMVTSDINLSK